MHSNKSLPRFLILQVIPKRPSDEDFEAVLSETKLLVETFGGNIVKVLTQKKDKPDKATYIGSGKIKDLQRWCEAEEIDVVVLDVLAKSGQLFRIEKELWKVNPKIMVWDRVDLILNIFDQHASTAEAKLQIELARSTHMGPRLYGLGKTELSRQGGGVGTRGKGETNIEFERRQINTNQQKIKKELAKLHKQKQSRIQRRNSLGIGPVALVGYTSAGKTTLFNKLTGKKKAQHRKLFTTLDTVVGKMESSDYRISYLVSDTIGFIENLPPVLIDSFKSTLLESLEAHLLLHVVDANDPRVIDKIYIVDKILDGLNANKPRLLVLNKSDLLSQSDREALETDIHYFFADRLEYRQELAKKARKAETVQSDYLGSLYISAKTDENIDLLKETIEGFFSQQQGVKAIPKTPSVEGV